MSSFGLHLPAVLGATQDSVQDFALSLVADAHAHLLGLDLVRLRDFLLEPLHGVGCPGRDVIVAVEQGLNLLVRVLQNTGVTLAPNEADADEVRAQRLLPATGRISSAVEAARCTRPC